MGQAHSAVAPRSKKILNWSLAAITVLALAVVVVVSIQDGRIAGRSAKPVPVNDIRTIVPVANPVTKLHTDFELEPKTLNELLDILNEDLHKVDIARMNLLCATRLPGTKGLDVDHALATLDQWAERVAMETTRHIYRVNDPRYAEHYGHSEAQFRAEMLAQVLQEDLGVKYNPEAVGNFSFADPSVGFIHGMIPSSGQRITDTPGGTCVSMPVLYVAVGRRLGYPLKLVTTDSHIFVRWEGERHPNPAWRERFNIETTNGFHRFDDDYYRTWPKPLTDQQIAANGFLESLTPAEGMAQFMAARGHHGQDVGQFSFAARCYENACRYDMRRPCYASWFANAAARSGYRPSTPALASLLAQKQQITAARRPTFDPGVPIPRATILPELPGAAHAATPAIRAFNQPTQPEQPFGSQP